MQSSLKLLILCLVFANAAIAEEVWLRGALVFFQKTSQAEIRDVETGRLITLADSSVEYSGGLVQISGGLGAEAHFKASNQVELQFQGPGHLAIERNEERVGAQGSAKAYLQTQMIFNLRYGRLIVDSRELEGDSIIVLESPVGRVTVSAGLWLIEVELNERTRNYNLRLECMDGRLRLTDRRGQNYFVNAGRRLTGAGASETLSIEITQMTEGAIELIDRYLEASANYKASYSAQALRDERQEVRKVNHIQTGLSGDGSSATASRPIVIEYAPRAESLTPFRGRLRDISDYEADLF